MGLRKDLALNELAESGNVAQFVSFEPSNGGPQQTFSRVWKYSPNHRFESPSQAIDELFANSPDGSINLRSFTPDNPRSREFLYGLTDPQKAFAELLRLSDSGLFVIANETVDVADGGVSGVIEGGVIEFSPDDTPRCVEKPGTVSLSLADGLSLLSTVYGFVPQLPECQHHRVEFSIHPRPRGYKRSHSLIWEYERVSTSDQKADIAWPNNLSRVIGDKAFGLLMAELFGMAVPKSLVIGRRLRPFSFGKDTGELTTWIRTCPVEQVPGRYTTACGWLDPFKLLAIEDPEQKAIASIIAQAGVDAKFSGAAITKKDGRLHFEGIAGSGEDFMLGRVKPQQLPGFVTNDITAIYQQLRDRLGAVRFEWVHDGKQLWIVQLHKGKTSSTTTTIVPGETTEWVTFRTDSGLEALRALLGTLPPNAGLLLEGEVGLTSHIADLVRKAARPARVLPRKVAEPQLKLFDSDHSSDAEEGIVPDAKAGFTNTVSPP